MKKKKYHAGGAHEDHHVSTQPNPRATPARPATPAQRPIPRGQIVPGPAPRGPRRSTGTPRPTERDPRRPTQPLMQPTQTGGMSAQAKLMQQQAILQQRAQEEMQRRMRAENEAFQKQLQELQSGKKRRIKRGSAMDRRRTQQQMSMAQRDAMRNRPTTQEEQIAFGNRMNRAQGTGRRINPNARGVAPRRRR